MRGVASFHSMGRGQGWGRFMRRRILLRMPRPRRMNAEEGKDVIDELGNIVQWGTSMRTLARELRQTMTEAEKILWKALRGNRLHGMQFYRQVAIDRFIVDFYCPRKRLAVEVDGGIHAEKYQKEHDSVRDAFLREKDVRILRVKNEEVLEDVKGVLTKIARECGYQPS